MVCEIAGAANFMPEREVNTAFWRTMPCGAVRSDFLSWMTGFIISKRSRLIRRSEGGVCHTHPETSH